jgi:hypothetical protein
MVLIHKAAELIEGITLIVENTGTNRNRYLSITLIAIIYF